MIVFENVSKSFKGISVIRNINFQVNTGELVVIIGESGCGKTTLLKMINRLTNPTEGHILVNNTDIATVDVIQLRRKIGYVIQQTGLFPHMTVKENIELIPKVEKLNKGFIHTNTNNLLSMVGLDPNIYADRYPTQLSGGQQQRIGVARALANDPNIILMDEPFSALDPITRSDLQDELLELQSNVKKTIVFVTHDMDEAIKIADKICIMKDGQILQYDTPENILKLPADEFVSNFVGKNRIWSSPEYIKVSDIMLTSPITCSKELQIIKAIERMRKEKVDSLIVIDIKTKKLEGILKIEKAHSVKDKSEKVSVAMNDEIVTLCESDNIIEAVRIIKETKYSTIPVVDENKILNGLITKSSLVTAFSQQYMDDEEATYEFI